MTKRFRRHVLTAALYERFSSRGEADFADKVLSAMRFQFGGHMEKEAGRWHGEAGIGRTGFFRRHGGSGIQEDFPSLQALVKTGRLNVPVIGVAKAGWNLDQLKARAKDGIEKNGALDRRRFQS